MNLNLSYNPFLFFEVIKALMYIYRWSFGIVLWEIATYGGLPYPDITSPFALVSQLATGYRMPRPDQCSEELYELMSSCWKENPLMRPAFSQIAQQLKNFLREVKTTYTNITEFNDGEA